MSSCTAVSRFFTPSPVKQKRPSEEDSTSNDRTPKRRKITTPSVSYSPAQNRRIQVKSTPQKPDSRAKKSRRQRLLECSAECVPKKRGTQEPRQEEKDLEPVSNLPPFPEFSSIVNDADVKSPNLEKRGKTTRKKQDVTGPSGKPWTDLEKQVLAFKKDNPGVLLMFEVGYKYKFFGDDANIAEKVLGLQAYQSHNFLTAVMNAFNREMYLKKLLAQGHIVGIVEQVETAAVKKTGDNRSHIFERKLTRLHTANTYIHQMGSTDDVMGDSTPPLMLVMERMTTSKVFFSVLAVSLATGDIVWDDFEDTPMRIELETRIAHLQPCEIILPQDIQDNSPTTKMLKALNETAGNEAHTFQIKHFSNTLSYTKAYELVSKFYTEASSSVSSMHAQIIAEITAYPKPVIILFAQAITYLEPFGVRDALLAAQSHIRFSARAHMHLSASTLANLEIYHNDMDGSTAGSLLSILDRTRTKFGARLLRTWVGKPLTDKRLLEERVGAIEEITASHATEVDKLRDLLKGLPDLVRGLTSVQCGKCSTRSFANLIEHCNRVAITSHRKQTKFNSSLLKRAVTAMSNMREPIQKIMQDISLERAAAGKKAQLWHNPQKYPNLTDWQELLKITEAELEDELRRVRALLGRSTLQWTTVATDEYLIELDTTFPVPLEVEQRWELINRTKSYARYRTPCTKAKLFERTRIKEQLQAEADNAYKSFLQEVSDKYYSALREGVNHLAVVDCLFSLAEVARLDGYNRPEFTDTEGELQVVDGRHPMAEVVRPDPFIPNTIRMDAEKRCLCLTGPNMGGKSSAVRMIALIAIMAQIGSYVPANSVRLSFIDGVYTRMGASDNIARGRSTFMSEMAETSDILAGASSKSLVILDELGRGTSTFDGMSIASAVLQHLLETARCRTLFITHYPSVVLELEKKHPRELQNLHMGYMETTLLDGTRSITFLYKVVPGLSPQSFGVECAKLAGIHSDILATAASKSQYMQRQIDDKRRKMRAIKLAKLVSQSIKEPNTSSLAQLTELYRQHSI